MTSFFAFFKKTLSALFERSSYISFRTVFVVLGLCFTIIAYIHEPIRTLDDALLRASHYFFEKPLGAANITVVEVPDVQVQQWQTDIYASNTLVALLSNILSDSSNTVGLLLEQPLDLGSSTADRVMTGSLEVLPPESLPVTNTKTNSDTPNEEEGSEEPQTPYVQTRTLLEHRALLLDYLRHPHVVVGVEGLIFNGQRPLLVGDKLVDDKLLDDRPLGDNAGVKSEESLQLGTWLAWLDSNVISNILPMCFVCRDEDKEPLIGRTQVQQFTYTPSSSPRLKPVFRISATHVLSGFFLQLIRSSEDIPADRNLTWGKLEGIRIGDVDLHLSSEGEFIAQNLLSERLSPAIDSITLNEALARSAFPQFTLIARQQSEDVQLLAKALYSIQHQALAHTPWWVAPIRALLFLLATVFLAIAITRLRLKTTWLITGALAFLLIVIPQILLVTKSWWLPLGSVCLWLVMGQASLSLWHMKKSRVQQILNRMDAMSITRARELLTREKPGQAFTLLAQCTAQEPVLQTLYEISDAFCEQKDYAQAVNVLTDIKRRSRSFKDTDQKLNVLKSMLKSAEEATSTGVLGKTMVISPVETKRTSIGRYRIEGEIGRGAMGQVFLGFDPKIARKIAIKTLRYDQFKDKSSDDLKTRFFREAEAAGRLNHPAIVSVFDVGEERDLAFIAMDFAEGNALNSFVSPDNLLPVFEVYRIVCDVAQALHYAHENNVVHRDIKPSNIIYNPAPYQVKVTDFGIARLVDNSQTSTGEILGSPLYMAPEQLKGKRVNHSADIFSLGATFYQLLTGHLPYEGNNLASLTHEILYGKHKNVRAMRKELPASAARIINQALQKDPNERYENAAEMALVLKKAIRRDFAQEAKRSQYM